MYGVLGILRKKKSVIVAFSVLGASLSLLFNNCSKINSQQADSSSMAGPSQFGAANTPVNPLNPYVLQCITESDGVKVSAKLAAAVIPSLAGGAKKLSSIDWNQDTDLIVTLDNKCVFDSQFADPILNYIDHSVINPDLPETVYVIKKESVTNLSLFIESAVNSECVITAEKNQVFHLNAVDPFFASQRHLLAIGATDSFLTSLMDYMPNGQTPDVVKVAIVDSGVDTANPDLTNMIAKVGTAVDGKNSTTKPTDGFLTDSGFHGTHVTGLVAAQFHNGVGGSGVYGNNVQIYPVRASTDGETLTLDALANGIDWAISKQVNIINMSVGATGDPSNTLKNAISRAIAANITIVVAAGNDGKQLGVGVNTYPAMYSSQFAGLITVGSIDSVTGAVSAFSNFSPNYVDIMAPGENGNIGILSTVPNSYNTANYDNEIKIGANYYPIEGTSMASPIVAGALAAVVSISKHKFTNVQLESLLKGNGSPKNSAYSTYSLNGNYLNLPTLINYVKTQIETLTPPTGGTLAISQQPTNKQLVAGESVELTVSVVAPTGATPTYQWYRNNLALPQTAAKLTLTNIGQQDAGVYKVQVKAGTATVTSQNAEVKVALKYCN